MRKIFDHFLKLSDVLKQCITSVQILQGASPQMQYFASFYFFLFLYKTGSMCEHLYLCVRTVNLHTVANKGE